mmetsp:Transcript_20541/g.19782  ORF Transcript_20541/g.19782 Transcript_20541/m.19782 type:complete len:325 (-) Transcript_20541:92-1066(-)
MAYERDIKSRRLLVSSSVVSVLSSIVLLIFATNCHAFAPSPKSSPIVHYSRDRNNKKNEVTRIFSSATTAEEVQPGLTKTITKKGNGERLRFGDIALVKYSCNVPSMPPFAKASKQKIQVNPGNGVFIKGWDLALSTMSIGERATICVEDAKEFGYGAAGVPPFIPSNSVIEMDIEILDVQDSSEMLKLDASGLLSNSENATPRTPAAIAAAYQTRQDEAEIIPVKEGLEGWIEKIKGFYFFGFFEGETGQKAPWILRPSITFPIAFFIVGAAFAVSIKLNAISERGSQGRDELDEIVLSATFIKDMLVYALMVQGGGRSDIGF